MRSRVPILVALTAASAAAVASFRGAGPPVQRPPEPDAASNPSSPTRPVDLPFPRLALYSQARVNPTPEMNARGDLRSHADPQPGDMARFDLLLLDANYPYWYPDLLREIRARNPAAILVCAWEAVWTYENWLPDNERFNDMPFHRGVRRDPRFDPKWLVVDANGKPLLHRHSRTFPPESDIFWTDPTDACPKGPTGMRFQDYLVARIDEELRAFPEYDGFMWDAVRHYGERGMDLDRDGVEERHAERATRWTAGIVGAMREVSRRFPSKLMLYQSGQVAFEDTPPEFREQLHGDVLPEFPRPSWKGSRAGDLVAYWAEGLLAQLRWTERARKPGIGWLSGGKRWQGGGDESSHYEYDRMRYTLGSACLVGAFSGYDGGDTGHHLRWWYDEYDACGMGKGWLGRPLGEAFAADDRSLSLRTALESGSARTLASHAWRRDFENGIVVVNPAVPGDLVARSAADRDGWIDLAFPGLRAGTVEVADSPGFQRPWARGEDYEADEAKGRVRLLAPGGRAASAPVFVRYEGAATDRTVELGEPFRLLRGAQDRHANDGSTVTRLTIPGRDARFLLRPSWIARAGFPLLVDDRSPEFSTTGSGWKRGGAGSFAGEIAGSGANRYDRSFLWVENRPGVGDGHAARWTPTVDAPGKFEVAFYAPHETTLHGGLPANSLRFVVHDARGTHERRGIDHTAHPHDWQPLGVFDFAAGTDGWVEVRADGSGGAVVADAVRFRPVER